ncbi:23S rRNA (adenine(2030)-N(6))-methyltransferase RlmJ [Bacteroides sp.]|uniref:23S rRNA (adenine(2030)-N(6))-methyltransferase RlmJ n=1 Tax=Bacteroides sp. TaxID=29523 RepID=UPI003AB4992F
MTTYTHYGKQADMLKHLGLCDVLSKEKPQVYVETNSACARYSMQHTPEQEYGIYHFLKEAPRFAPLAQSPYYQIENQSMQNETYIGSPGLAMNILKDTADRYIFFDLEQPSLDTVREYAVQQGLSPRVTIYNCDSISGTLALLPSLSPKAFLHIDPYEIDRPNDDGHTYLDVFVEAARRGMKCFLWYGYINPEMKKKLNDEIREAVEQHQIKDCVCVELIVDFIRQTPIPCNPGVLGSGILTANLSEDSNKTLLEDAELLTECYKRSSYKGHPGKVYKDIILQ